MSELDERRKSLVGQGVDSAIFALVRRFRPELDARETSRLHCAVLDALASAPAPTVSGEAVAWRVRPMPGFAWVYVEGDPDRNPALRDYEKQPVYVHPSPTRAEVLEEAAKIAEARSEAASKRQRKAYDMGRGMQGETEWARNCEAMEIANAIRALAEEKP